MRGARLQFLPSRIVYQAQLLPRCRARRACGIRDYDPQNLSASFRTAFRAPSSGLQGSAGMREPWVGSALQQLLDSMPPEMARRLAVQDEDAAAEDAATDVRVRSTAALLLRFLASRAPVAVLAVAGCACLSGKGRVSMCPSSCGRYLVGGKCPHLAPCNPD